MSLDKTAASVLWRYSDPDSDGSGNFYLPEKTTPVKSPWSGKAVTGRPERMSLSDVGGELKEPEKTAAVDDPLFWKMAALETKARQKLLMDIYKRQPVGNKMFRGGKHSVMLFGNAAKSLGLNTYDSVILEDLSDDDLVTLGAAYGFKAPEAKTAAATLWKYTDGEGKVFFLETKTLTPLRSPYSGKTFTPKPERSPLSEVGKELKVASGFDASTEAAQLLERGGQHPVFRLLRAAFEDALRATEDASKIHASLKVAGVGSNEAPELVLKRVRPKVERIARLAKILAEQMGEKFDPR